jgi:hypothetical protein
MVAKKAPMKKMAAPAKKAPAKKTPSSAADFRKADQKSIKQERRTYGGSAPKRPAYSKYSDAQATAEIKKAFMKQALIGTKSEQNQYQRPKQKITLSSWAANIDNTLGDTWFEGAAASDIGFDRASKILRQNREKWLKPLYEGTKKVETRTTLGSKGASTKKNKKK